MQEAKDSKDIRLLAINLSPAASSVARAFTCSSATSRTSTQLLFIEYGYLPVEFVQSISQNLAILELSPDGAAVSSPRGCSNDNEAPANGKYCLIKTTYSMHQ